MAPDALSKPLSEDLAVSVRLQERTEDALGLGVQLGDAALQIAEVGVEPQGVLRIKTRNRGQRPPCR